MAVRDSQVIPQAPRLGLIVLLLVLAGFVLWFLGHSAFPYTSYDKATYQDFWPRRYGLIVHIAGGMTALLTGLVQLWLGLTGRTRTLHRTLGRVYVSSIAVASAGAIYLAVTIDPQYFAYSAGLLGLAGAWLVTTSMALWSIHRRAIEQHREWMLRSYVVTFAFVDFRFFANLMRDWKVASGTEIDAFMAFACWAIPLLLAEPLIQWRKIRRTRVPG